MNTKLAVFQEKEIRRIWDVEKGEGYNLEKLSFIMEQVSKFKEE